jgi:hypothetical protein
MGESSSCDFGPFAETTDLIAGWMVIDVGTEDRAIELAGELSRRPTGSRSWSGRSRRSAGHIPVVAHDS